MATTLIGRQLNEESINKMSFLEIIALLKRISTKISQDGDCPVCGEWLILLDVNGDEVMADESYVAFREMHTAECCIGKMRNSLQAALADSPIEA